MNLRLATISLALRFATSQAAAASVERRDGTITKRVHKNNHDKDVYHLRKTTVDRRPPISFSGLECNPTLTRASIKDAASITSSSRSKPLSNSLCGASGRYACVNDSSSSMGGRCHRRDVSAEENVAALSSKTETRSTRALEDILDSIPRKCEYGYSANPRKGCQEDEFCELSEGTCIISDTFHFHVGVCSKKPNSCIGEIDEAVCGCDGISYSNPCVARSAGTSIRNMGVCEAIFTTSSFTDTTSAGNTACLSLEDCRTKSEAMGFQDFDIGDYPSKGCFYKKDNAFWSPGSIDEMSEADLPGIQERIWCNDEVYMTSSTTTETACLTEEECKTKSDEMGLQNFDAGDHPTKGCFSKKGNAFWSLGTVKEMSEADLPGVQERIWCTDDLQGATFTEPTDSTGNSAVVVVVIAPETTSSTTTTTISTSTTTAATTSTSLSKLSSPPTSSPTKNYIFDSKNPSQSPETPNPTVKPTPKPTTSPSKKPSKSPETPNPTMIPFPPGPSENQDSSQDGQSAQISNNNIACLTPSECNARSTELGFIYFMQGTFPTKGCFSKSGNSNTAFFSPGTEEEMADPDVPGVQERIWCGTITTDSLSLSPTESYAPTPLDILDTIPPTASPELITVRPLKPGDDGVATDPNFKEGMPSKSPTKYPTKAPFAEKPPNNPTSSPITNAANAARESDVDSIGSSHGVATRRVMFSNNGIVTGMAMMAIVPTFLF